MIFLSILRLFLLSRRFFLPLSILLASCNAYLKDCVVIIPLLVFLRVVLASVNPYQNDYAIIVGSHVFLYVILSWGNPYQKDSAIIVRSLFFPFILSLHQVLLKNPLISSCDHLFD